MATDTEPGTRRDDRMDPGRREPRRWLSAIVTVGVCAVMILGFVLAVYRYRHFRVPVGWDVMDYIWRTRVAGEVGIQHIRDAVVPGMFVKQGRPAFIVLAAMISSLSGASLLRVAMVLPALAAAAAGLAAGALARLGDGLSRWGFAFVALAVGASMNVVLMLQYGYFDNLAVTSVVLAVLVATVPAVEDRRGLVPAILLLGAAGLVETPFFALAAGVLLVSALAYAPASWRRWRSGSEGLLDTPSLRLGEIVAGGALVTGAVVYGLTANPPEPRLSRVELTTKLRADIPRYHLPFLLPLGALGIASLWGRGRGADQKASRARLVLTLLAVWSGVAAAAYLVYRVAPSVSVPANRFLLFAVSVPILGALGVIWLARRARRLGPAAAAAVLLVALAASWFVAGSEWLHTTNYLDPAKVDDASAVEAYLDAAGIPADRPVVFVVDDRGPSIVSSVTLMRDEIFATLPIERLGDVYVFLGAPEDLLAGHSSSLPGNPRYARASDLFLRLIRKNGVTDPVIVITESMNGAHWSSWLAANPDGLVPGTRVGVVRGPSPSEPTSAAPTLKPPGSIRLGLLAVAGFALLWVAGAGWVLALVPGWVGRITLLAIAPAAGLAALVAGGLLADHVGIRLTGTWGAVIPVGVALLGWVVFGLGRMRTRRRAGYSR